MNTKRRSEVTCPGCGTRNRVPVTASGRPRCATCKSDLPWLADVGTADFDQEPEVSVRLGVRGIPTMVLFRDGREVARQVGALPGDRIARWIDDALTA